MLRLRLVFAATILLMSAPSSDANPVARAQQALKYVVGAGVGGIIGNRADEAFGSIVDRSPHGKSCSIVLFGVDSRYDLPQTYPVGTDCWVDTTLGNRYYGKVVQ